MPVRLGLRFRLFEAGRNHFFFRQSRPCTFFHWLQSNKALSACYEAALLKNQFFRGSSSCSSVFSLFVPAVLFPPLYQHYGQLPVLSQASGPQVQALPFFSAFGGSCSTVSSTACGSAFCSSWLFMFSGSLASCVC